MMLRVSVLVPLLLAVVGAAKGQIIFNEAHGLPTGNGPVRLLGDYVELWNQSPTPINLAGYTLGLWNTDTAVPTVKVIPAGPASTWIPGYGFYIFEEGGVLGDVLCDANLAGFPGMMMGTSPWTSNGNLGAYLRDAMGNCVDYMYLRRGTTAPPATSPNLPAGCVWTLGNIGTTGASPTSSGTRTRRRTASPTGATTRRSTSGRRVLPILRRPRRLRRRLAPTCLRTTWTTAGTGSRTRPARR
jgi:hypothetical protein